MTTESPRSDSVTDDSDGAQPAAPPRPKPTLQFGRVKLTGLPALLVQTAFFAALGALIVYSRPRVSILVSAAIWLAMDVYWSIAERKRPKAKSGESPESRQRHALLTTTALLLLFLPIRGLTGQFVPDTFTTALVGLGVQIAFTLFYLFARFYLGHLWSGAITIMSDHRLIETGPYRFLRHPMYTGMLGMFVGTAIVSGQYHALIGVAVGMLAYWRKIRIEERVLADEFGELFQAYRRRTAALVPWLF
jgi:protein-S-isoprenylcysteine O-methyltransferase Ste14